MKPLRGLILGAALWPSLAWPPAVADPMRPLVTPGAASNPTMVPSAAAAGGAATGANATPVRRLLAIRQDSNGERSALFGDRWLRAGDRYTAPQGETWVLEVGSNHIELEQDKVKTSHHLLAPLLPPQWPALPASRPAPTPSARTSPAPQAAPAPTPAAVSAPAPTPASPRPERPPSS